MSVTIKDKTSQTPLASGKPDVDVVKFEGNWYFLPSAVEAQVLTITDRTYTCPSKGTCNWVDAQRPDGTVAKDVAWIYKTPKPGHERIAGRYGFYAGTRGATQEG